MTQDPKDRLPTDPSAPNRPDPSSIQADFVAGNKIQGDLIVTGDIHGSYIAIGRGAQVIVQQVLSVAQEAEQRHQLETQILAQAVAHYVDRLRIQVHLPPLASQGDREDLPSLEGRGGRENLPPLGGRRGREDLPPLGGRRGLPLEPYKSLLPYRLADAPFFFGRDQARAELLPGLAPGSRTRLTILHSESGAGKTSLLQAGLAAPLLAQGHLPLYVRAWRHSPSLAIKQTLLPDLTRTPDLAQLPLRAFLARLTGLLGLSTLVYILLDQFEEFFIRLADEETQKEFIEDLGQCVEDETLPVRFILSLRKDHFANLSDFRDRLPYIFAHEYPLKLFTRAEAASAITAPATLVGLTYEPGVVDQILDELQAQAQKVIMPAQLQLVCWALYRALGSNDFSRSSGEQHTITLAMLQRLGGVAGILRNYLHDVITREIPIKRREQAQQVLEALIRSDRTRDVQTAAQLARQLGGASPLQEAGGTSPLWGAGGAAGASPLQEASGSSFRLHPSSLPIPPVLNDLISSRLLRVVETGPQEEVAYELAHDYLIDQIELDPEVLARKAAQELLDQEVAAWQRNPQLRIGEEKLKIIEAQAAKIHFSPEAEKLYRLSKNVRQRRRRILFGLFGLALLVSCLALFLYYSLGITQENLGIAHNALVTATSVIQSAWDEADAAAIRQATAERAANVAQTAQFEAIAAEATASLARQTAEAGRQVAAQAEQTAIAARYAAQTRQAEAEQNAAVALASQATAQAAGQQAIAAQQTAQANQATAQASEQLAIQARQTAQAQQAVAEQTARQAQAAAAAAQQAQAIAEAARQEAEQARRDAERARREAERAQRDAEEQAAQAQRDKEQAQQAAQQAEATRVAVEALRDQAEQELRETQRSAAIVRDTRDCPVGGNPGALATDGTHIWVTNKLDNTLTRLSATDCTNLGTFATGSGPADVIYGGGYIWVANRLDNTITKINIAAGTTLATFTAGPPGSWPTSLLYDGTALWVASETTNKIRKIDPDTGADLGTYDTGNTPFDLAYDGSQIWIANFLSNTVSRLDANTGANTGVFPVGFRPTWLTYDGHHIWVANRGSNTLTKLRVSDGALLGTFKTGRFPDALAFDGLNIWVANQDDNTITRLQPVDGTLLSTLPTAKTPTAMLFDGANMWLVAEDDDLVQKIPVTINLVGQEPVAMAYDGLYIWVANQADNTVSKMLASTDEWVASFGLGNQPVALLSVGANIWVAHQGDNSVSKFRAADGAGLGTFPVGDAPSALTYDGLYIWVTNKDSNNVTRLRESDGANTGTFPVGSRPVDILYDGSHLWVANEGDQSLRKLNPAGAPVSTYNLGITPRSFVYDGAYFWIGYTVDAFPAPPETKLLQLRTVDGAIVSDTATGITGAPAIAPAAVAYDGTYVWLSSPNTIGDSIVTRFEAATPGRFVNFPVCDGPSALLYTGSVWVACKDDNLIQKLPGNTGLTSQQVQLFGGGLHHYLPIIVKQK